MSISFFGCVEVEPNIDTQFTDELNLSNSNARAFARYLGLELTQSAGDFYVFDPALREAGREHVLRTVRSRVHSLRGQPGPVADLRGEGRTPGRELVPRRHQPAVLDPRN